MLSAACTNCQGLDKTGPVDNRCPGSQALLAFSGDASQSVANVPQARPILLDLGEAQDPKTPHHQGAVLTPHNLGYCTPHGAAVHAALRF